MPRHPLWTVRLWAATIAMAAVTTATAQTLVVEANLKASDAAVDDQFGIAVSLSGDRAVIGAFSDDTASGSGTGSAYVFRLAGSEWIQEARLNAFDAAPNDNFGQSVAISADLIVIGAPEKSSPGASAAGAAYVFRREGSSWIQEAKLVAPTPTTTDRFGQSVSISGDRIIVGAIGDDTSAGVNTGSAFVFLRNGTSWAQEANLIASDASANDYFGLSVSISGTRAVVGTLNDNTPAGLQAGSVYIFQWTGTAWTETAHLFASDGAALDIFGVSVHLSGERLAVGANGDDTAGGTDAGSVYVYRKEGASWVQEAHVFASDPAPFDDFGNSVCLSGDLLAVGADGDDTQAGNFVGSVYLFHRNGLIWEQVQKITNPGPAEFDQFGFCVSLAENRLLIGAMQDDTAAGANTGSAYVYAPPPPPCFGDINSDGAVNGADLSFFLGVFGSTVEEFPLAADADFNLDGVVNGADLSVLLGNFGTAC